MANSVLLDVSAKTVRAFGCRHSAVAIGLIVAATAGCAESGRSEGGALVVRQVLSNNANTSIVSPATEAPGAVPSPVPGMSLGSTLVADSPRALYRRAYDQSRRRADGDSPRERLVAIDTLIDQVAQEQQSFFEE